MIILKKIWILFTFIIANNAFSFNLMNNIHNVIKPRNNFVRMYYIKLKNYDEKLNVLPSFQTNIIINNWINYINYNKKESLEYVNKSTYDFKVLLAINRQKEGTIYFAWCPNVLNNDQNVVYLIGGIQRKGILHIYRIAQNPYFENMLLVDSNELYNELQRYVRDCEHLHYISFDKLHEYDPRYLLSWSI